MLLYNFLKYITYLWIFTTTLGVNQGRHNYFGIAEENAEIHRGKII